MYTQKRSTRILTDRWPKFDLNSACWPSEASEAVVGSVGRRNSGCISIKIDLTHIPFQSLEAPGLAIGHPCCRPSRKTCSESTSTSEADKNWASVLHKGEQDSFSEAFLFALALHTKTPPAGSFCSGRTATQTLFELFYDRRSHNKWIQSSLRANEHYLCASTKHWKRVVVKVRSVLKADLITDRPRARANCVNVLFYIGRRQQCREFRDKPRVPFACVARRFYYSSHRGDVKAARAQFRLIKQRTLSENYGS